MSDSTETGRAGSGAAAGGIPSESDLPSMQGLADSVDDPSDPTAAREGAAGTEAAAFSTEDDGGPSDPLPDMSGSSGSR